MECKKINLLKVFSKATGKSNLDIHLENCHKISVLKRKRGVSQPNNQTRRVELESTVVGKNFRSTLSESDQQLLMLNIEMFFRTPFDTFLIHNEQFQRFFTMINKDYRAPIRTEWLNSVIDTFYGEKFEFIKSRLNEAKFITISLEQWTASGIDGITCDYVTINAHFIEKHTNFYFRSCCLSIQPLKLIQEKFQETLTTFKIDKNNVFSTVTNKKSLLIDLNIKNGYVCLGTLLQATIASTFNRIYNDEESSKFSSLSDAVQKWDSIATLITDSATTNSEGMSTANLKHKNSLNWRKNYKLIKQVCESNALIENKMNAQLSSNELSMLKNLVDLLESFSKIQELLLVNTPSGSFYASSSIILPSVKHLDKCLSEKASDSQTTALLKSTLRKPITDYMVEFSINLESSNNIFLLASAFLDPYYKDLKFIDKLSRKSCLIKLKKYLISMLNDIGERLNMDCSLREDTAEVSASKRPMLEKSQQIEGQSTINNSDKKRLVFQDSDEENSDDEVESTSPLATSLKLEIKSYMDDMDSYEVLTFWRIKKDTYPVLSKLATVILSMSATCTSSKNLCDESSSGQSATRYRFIEKKLGEPNLEKIIFIFQNFDLII